MAGRHSILTPELQSRICSFIQAGAYDHVAATAAGISRTAFFSWLDRGKDANSGKFKEFADAVNKAREQCRASAEIEVRKADPKWWLSKRYKEDWGQDYEQTGHSQFHIEIYLGPTPQIALEPIPAVLIDDKE